MERDVALVELNKLIGTDLRALANELGIIVWRDVPADASLAQRLNKGWAGHTLERYLGLPLNSAQSPNFGSWELKQVSLRNRPRVGICVKETMAITMIDPVEVSSKPFEQSHLYNKLKKIVVVARTYESQLEERSMVHSVGAFDLEEPRIFEQVKADYELVRETIRESGFSSLSGAMGKLIQPRTKGRGHGSISRAFYARSGFVAHILGLKVCKF